MKSKKFPTEHLDEVHKNNFFQPLLEVFEQASELKSKNLACGYLELVISFLQSAKKNDWFLDTFTHNLGYSSISSLLKGCHEKDNQTRILDCILQLSYLGKANLAGLIVEIDRDLPFQNPGFMIPFAIPGKLC